MFDIVAEIVHIISKMYGYASEIGIVFLTMSNYRASRYSDQYVDSVAIHLDRMSRKKKLRHGVGMVGKNALFPLCESHILLHSL
jgi:hypothetical protein